MSAKKILLFLGFARFYQKFVKDYSKITTSLMEITGKDIIFTWGSKEQKAFNILKKWFTTKSILIMFDLTKPIMLETNASDLALGTVISQQKLNKIWYSVAFYSQKLTIPEQNYKIHNKKLLAIVELMKHWRVYLEGSKHQVQVYLDHKNLMYFTIIKELNQQQIQWSKELTQYNFKIIHQRKSENTKTNALNQREDYMCSVLKTKDTIL